MSGYYATAEPVGVCTCHSCQCSGCAQCDDPADLFTDEPPEEDE